MAVSGKTCFHLAREGQRHPPWGGGAPGMQAIPPFDPCESLRPAACTSPKGPKAGRQASSSPKGEALPAPAPASATQPTPSPDSARRSPTPRTTDGPAKWRCARRACRWACRATLRAAAEVGAGWEARSSRRSRRSARPVRAVPGGSSTTRLSRTHGRSCKPGSGRKPSACCATGQGLVGRCLNPTHGPVVGRRARAAGGGGWRPAGWWSEHCGPCAGLHVCALALLLPLPPSACQPAGACPVSPSSRARGCCVRRAAVRPRLPLAAGPWPCQAADRDDEPAGAAGLTGGLARAGP